MQQTICALIQEPYGNVLGLVRRMLVRRGLRLVDEIDLSKRLERELGMEWKYASTMLVVDDPSSLYEAVVQDSIGGLHVLHLVAVTGDNDATRIAVNVAAAPQRPRHGSMAQSVGSDVGSRVADVIRTIAEHYDAIMLVRTARARSVLPVTASEEEQTAEPASVA